MKILHLLSQLELTGAEVYAAELVSSQIQSQHEVYLISDNIHVPLNIPWTSMNMATRSFSKRLKNIIALRKFLKTHQIQVIHCHSRAACRHAYWARLGLKLGLVTTLHGRQHYSLSKRLFDIYGEFQIAICKNVGLAQKYLFKTPDYKIKLIPNPVPNFQFQNDLAREQRILIAGRNSGPKGKRIEALVRGVLPPLFKKYPDLKIDIIAGDKSKWSSSFLAFVKDLNQLTVKDPVANLAGELFQYQLVIASGRIAIEALLQGVPNMALGEFDYLGLISSQSLAKAKDSNFGDIGAQELEHDLDCNQIFKDLDSYLQREKNNIDFLHDRRSLHSQLAVYFDQKRVSAEILEVYRAAIFKRHIPRNIPILMYHKTPDAFIDSQHRIFVTKEDFEKHLASFKKMKFSTLNFADLLAFWNLQKPYTLFPKKPLILTFDDGYKDNLTNAQPLLKKYSMKAVIFLLADHTILTNTWDMVTGEAPERLMSLEEKKQLDPTVFEIGSHGFRHLHLNKIAKSEALQEMESSKEILEKDFNTKVLAFAYPFGSVDESLPEIAKEAGYSFAVNTDTGVLHLADNPRSLFRVNVFPEETRSSLKKKTSWWYRKYFYFKRGH